jgi:P27 family predicted phage terminase small subunit
MAGTGMSGASRKPTAMKILEGTFRADRSVPDEPQPEKLLIPPPMPESLNEYGKRHWESCSLEMVKIGLLTVIDIDQFAAYCNEMGAYWFAEEKRKSALEALEYTEINRWFNFAQKHLKAGRDLAVQFGLTPASRSRINVPKQEPKNELDEI